MYRLAPGTDVVRVDDERVLLRSDLVTVRLAGRSAGTFHDRVLPLLDGRRSLADLAGDLPELDPDELRRHLDDLVAAGVLRRDTGPPTVPADVARRAAPLLAYLEAAGLPPPEAHRRLAGLRVAVVGLEGPGAHAAATMAASGIGTLVLVDPYPCQPGDLNLLPPMAPGTLGLAREQALQRTLAADHPDTRVEVSGSPTVTEAGVRALADGCQLLVGCFDRGFGAVQHWLNRASLDQRVPAVYARVGGHTALVGPLVAPGRSACYLCWRMRSVACATSFAEAMAYEELLDGRRRPALHERAVLPGLASHVGGLVALEALKHLLGLEGRTLVGRVHEFDALRLETRLHAVLPVPACPACGGGSQGRTHPRRSELAGRGRPAGDVLQAESSLVSHRCGVVTALQPAAPATGDPSALHLVGAQLANHRFLADHGAEERACSGKGLSPAEARRSVLGEAVERYSGATWSAGEVRRARRGELEGPALDPRSLVLYRPEQYAALPYAPYAESATLGWVQARSLVSGALVHVPALAVLLGYQPASAEEFLCPTSSNGLAAGATLADAVLAATYEVLERDAFLVTWMNRLPAERADPWSHPHGDLVGMCADYRREGIEPRLYRLATDHPCQVFLALGVEPDSGQGPAAAVGLGADLDPVKAARKAVLEMGQVRSGLCVRLRAPGARARVDRLVADPGLVASMHDHGLLYADHRSLGAFGFLERGPAAEVDWTAPAPPDADARLGLLVEHFRSAGGDLLYADRTPPDMAGLGLYTARALVPGFQPLHFGAREARLAGERLYELPRRLGHRPRPTTPDELNQDPHPLA